MLFLVFISRQAWSYYITMNKIWSVLMLIGVVAMFFAKPQDTLEGMIDAVNNA